MGEHGPPDEGRAEWENGEVLEHGLVWQMWGKKGAAKPTHLNACRNRDMANTSKRAFFSCRVVVSSFLDLSRESIGGGVRWQEGRGEEGTRRGAPLRSLGCGVRFGQDASATRARTTVRLRRFQSHAWHFSVIFPLALLILESRRLL